MPSEEVYTCEDLANHVLSMLPACFLSMYLQPTLLYVCNTSTGAMQVELMYRRCGFDVDPSASTLQMLTNIEMRLEDYLKQVWFQPLRVQACQSEFSD